MNTEHAFDVIVVGGGGSGLAAAIEAGTCGARVLLIEKNEALGGSTALSFGSIAASGTPHQARSGIVDHPEQHCRELAGFNGELDGRDNPRLRRILADEMPATFRWLLAQGVRLYGPIPEPDKTPRLHVVLPNSRSFITHLAKSARDAGVEISCGLRASELLVENGRVVGIACERAGARITFGARAGVVLATGDFTNDPELKAQYMGSRESKVDGINAGATGDGQKLATRLGARILNGDLALGPELRFISPPRPSALLRLPPSPALASAMVWSLRRLPRFVLRPLVMRFVTVSPPLSPSLFTQGALLVNRRGELVAEDGSNPALAVPEQPEKVAYILLDRRLTQLFGGGAQFVSTAPGISYAYVNDYRRSRPDVFCASQTLSGLASRLGMPPSTLQDSVDRANLQRTSEMRFTEGPYAALGPVRAVFVHSEGGLAVDDSHRVIRADGLPIPGLYAAGAVGQGGLLLKGYGHHLGWAFVSGRRAGRHAASQGVAAALPA